MRIAIASGKGGTGKTTLATNLAWVASQQGRSVAYLDCDVEEPNGHLFLQPAITDQRSVEKPVPHVDAARCTHCGRCAAACRFGAVASLPKRTMVFAELCHSCGGCLLACPAEAIHEEPRPIGRLRIGQSGSIRFVEGALAVGEAMSPPVIRAVKSAPAVAQTADLTILDAPPGTSCPVIETIRGCDRVILVTEPTPFGLHDLTLAVAMVRAMAIPFAVVVNRAGIGDGRVQDYCDGNGIPVLAEIPDDRSVAQAYSRGQIISQAAPTFRQHIAVLLERLLCKAHP